MSLDNDEKATTDAREYHSWSDRIQNSITQRHHLYGDIM